MRKQSGKSMVFLLFSAVIKVGETSWPRYRVSYSRTDSVKLQDGSLIKPYADMRLVRMLVISERSTETCGTFSSADEAGQVRGASFVRTSRKSFTRQCR